MKHTLFVLYKSVRLWLFTFGILWLGALLWLHSNHAEVYKYLAPGIPGGLKMIDNSVLERFYQDRLLAISISAVASLVLSQVSFALSFLRKETE